MTWQSIALGYAVSLLVGGAVIFPVWRWMWHLASAGQTNLKAPNTLAIIQGIVERALYTSSIVLGKPEGIAVWLGFKALMRVKINDDDPLHVPGSAIYLVGTALSVFFGVAGGLIARNATQL